jgi:hypothetical protein
LNNEQNIFNQIYNQEVAPPPAMWKRIESKLDEIEQENVHIAPVVNILEAKKAKNNWLKVALAACSLGLIAMTAMWMIEKNKKKNTEIAANTTIVDNDTKKQDQVINAPVEAPKAITDSNNGLPLPNTSTTYSDGLVSSNSNFGTDNNQAVNNKNTQSKATSNNIYSNNTVDNNSSTSQQKTSNQSNTSTANNSTSNDPINNPPKNIAEVNYLDPSQTIGPLNQNDKTISNILSRISVNDDNEELDSIIEKSAYWKQQINIWRQQLLKGGYTPSIINNLDIIELKKLIDTKVPKTGNK